MEKHGCFLTVADGFPEFNQIQLLPFLVVVAIYLS
jgi:hypothetical protein